MTPEIEFKRLRTFITVAQILALVSLFIGGIPLSLAASILALIALIRSNRFLSLSQEPPVNPDQGFQGGFPPNPARGKIPQGGTVPPGPWLSLRRSAAIVLGICLLALVINIMAFIAIVPKMLSILQGGDSGSLFSDGAFGPTESKGSIWG